jgi:hypothetical protein
MKLPFDVNDPELLDCFTGYVEENFKYTPGRISKPAVSGGLLSDWERYYRKLNLYYSFAKNFGLAFDPEWVYRERALVGERIKPPAAPPLKPVPVPADQPNGKASFVPLRRGRFRVLKFAVPAPSAAGLRKKQTPAPKIPISEKGSRIRRGRRILLPFPPGTNRSRPV